MINETELSALLFFDLETSSEYSSYDELKENNPRKAALWATKHDKAAAKDPEKWGTDYNKSYISLAPLIPEFGRIVCGSFSHVTTASSDSKMIWSGRMKSFNDNLATDKSEIDLVLKPISNLLMSLDKAGKSMRLCGHNIKKFDIPYLAKRMIMSGISVPPQLQTWGKKPWEVTHLDTSELWSFGNWDGYVSLDLLACSLEVPSPKGNLKGEYVGAAFWKDKIYGDIEKYCEGDVKCVARICHKLSGSILPLEI